MFGICQKLFLIVVLVIAVGFPATARDQKTVLYMSFDQEPEGETVEDESGHEKPKIDSWQLTNECVCDSLYAWKI